MRPIERIIEGGGGLLTADGNSVAIYDGSKVRILGNYFIIVLGVNKGSHRVLSLPIWPRDTDELQITEDAVRLRLWNINLSKSAGPNENHPAVIIPPKDLLVGPTLRLYKATVQRGYLPQEWESEMAVVI